MFCNMLIWIKPAVNNFQKFGLCRTSELTYKHNKRGYGHFVTWSLLRTIRYMGTSIQDTSLHGQFVTQILRTWTLCPMDSPTISFSKQANGIWLIAMLLWFLIVTWLSNVTISIVTGRSRVNIVK